MSFGERRYRRYFEKADYGKFRNSIYDVVNKMFGFMPSTIFRYEIGKRIDEIPDFMQEANYMELKKCPFCKKNAVFIGVHDDAGNYHGNLGCEYEQNPWSGLSYALHHEGWGDCILCTDDTEQTMGGVLFDTVEEAIEEWNKGA